MSIFKQNDIRGRYPEEWNSLAAYKIGCALSGIFKEKKIVIGRDGRETSAEIFDFLTQGLMRVGFNIYDIGVVDTPAVYFSVGKYGFDGGLMITASHNPAGYNGIKITLKDAVPVDYETGIKKIENLVKEMSVVPSDEHQKQVLTAGIIQEFDIERSYVDFLDSFKEDYAGLKVVVDCSNGAAGRFIRSMFHDYKGSLEILNDTIDGTFPAHGPNPSAVESLTQLKRAVLETGAEIGFCFDGDADRVVMVDDKGSTVSPDIITAILSLYILEEKGDQVLVDIRSSNSVKEFLLGNGASPLICPVGHAKIKKMLRDTGALYGGELTGHHYFRDNYYCDSAWITVFTILNVIAELGESLSSLSSRIMKYAFSGEKSFKLPDQQKQDMVLKKLMKKYSDADMDILDGIRFNYPDWWFIVRKSGTEPLLRLVLEADTKGKMNEKLEAISTEISEYITEQE